VFSSIAIGTHNITCSEEWRYKLFAFWHTNLSVVLAPPVVLETTAHWNPSNIVAPIMIGVMVLLLDGWQEGGCYNELWLAGCPTQQPKYNHWCNWISIPMSCIWMGVGRYLEDYLKRILRQRMYIGVSLPVGTLRKDPGFCGQVITR